MNNLIRISMRNKEFIKKNKRYFFVAILLLMTVIYNQVISKKEIKKDQSMVSQATTINNANPEKKFDDVIDSSAKEFYRLIFREKSNKDARIIIQIVAPSNEIMKIGDIEVAKSDKYAFHEVLFSTNGKYNDVKFSKENKDDNAEISIIETQVFKLNVSSEEEFAKFIPTIIGDSEVSISDPQQTDGSRQFFQLSEPLITFGQIFKSNTDFITSVDFDFDVVKQKNRTNDDKYKIELREANFDGGVPEVAGSLSSISFSVSDLEKYRQPDGKFRFPIFSKVEKGKHYFIGINNNHADVDKFNYLKIKGASDFEKYSDGITTVVINKQAYAVDGQLYFVVHGDKFNEYNGVKVLSGTVIEDLGGSKGLFKYIPLNNIYDKADLYLSTDDVSFNLAKAIIFGTSKSDYKSNYIYKFETIFPFNKFRIFGQQADVSWDKVAVSYSFDEKKWMEIPSNGELQNFDYTTTETTPKKQIYVKIEPKGSSDTGKKYGLANFSFEADLIMK